MNCIFYIYILTRADCLCVKSALAVAFINIRIPLLIGGLVNVLSKYASPEASTASSHSSFMEDIKQPALQLVSMYALQVLSAFTPVFCGIIVLSCPVWVWGCKQLSKCLTE